MSFRLERRHIYSIIALGLGVGIGYGAALLHLEWQHFNFDHKFQVSGFVSNLLSAGIIFLAAFLVGYRLDRWSSERRAEKEQAARRIENVYKLLHGYRGAVRQHKSGRGTRGNAVRAARQLSFAIAGLGKVVQVFEFTAAEDSHEILKAQFMDYRHHVDNEILDDDGRIGSGDEERAFSEVEQSLDVLFRDLNRSK